MNNNFSDTVYNGYLQLIQSGSISLTNYIELQAIANMAKDLGYNVTWNTPEGKLTLI